MRKYAIAIITAALVFGSAAGCAKKKPATEKKTPAASAVPAKPADNEKYAFDRLCDRLVLESKAAAADFPPDVEKKVMENCMAASNGYKKDPKTKKAMEAYANYILNACDPQKGKKWLECNTATVDKAAKAASAAVK